MLDFKLLIINSLNFARLKMSRVKRPQTASSSNLTNAGARGGQLSHEMQLQLKKLLLTISKGEKSIER